MLIGGAVVRALAQASSPATVGSWDLQLLRCLFAEARTSGVYGYRPAELPRAALDGPGKWRSYFNSTALPRGQIGGSQPH